MRDIPIGCAGDTFCKLDAYRPYRCQKRDVFLGCFFCPSWLQSILMQANCPKRRKKIKTGEGLQPKHLGRLTTSNTSIDIHVIIDNIPSKKHEMH